MPRPPDGPADPKENQCYDHCRWQQDISPKTFRAPAVGSAIAHRIYREQKQEERDSNECRNGATPFFSASQSVVTIFGHVAILNERLKKSIPFRTAPRRRPNVGSPQQIRQSGPSGHGNRADVCSHH